MKKKSKKKKKATNTKEVDRYYNLIKKELAAKKRKKNFLFNIYIGYDMTVPKKQLSMLNKRLAKDNLQTQPVQERADDVAKPYATWNIFLEVKKI